MHKIIKGFALSHWKYRTSPGKVLPLNLQDSQWELLGLLLGRAKNQQELIVMLRKNPWDPITYDNPSKLKREDIIKGLKTSGVSHLARILIRK